MVWYASVCFYLWADRAGGNLVSVLIRYMIGSNPRIHSGGGSVVIMGLVGLCAVVGLRSETRMGVSMGRLMVFFMVTTAVIGPRCRNSSTTGAMRVVRWWECLGFAHRALLAAVNRPSAWGRGVVTGQS